MSKIKELIVILVLMLLSANGTVATSWWTQNTSQFQQFNDSIQTNATVNLSSMVSSVINGTVTYNITTIRGNTTYPIDVASLTPNDVGTWTGQNSVRSIMRIGWNNYLNNSYNSPTKYHWVRIRVSARTSYTGVITSSFFGRTANDWRDIVPNSSVQVFWNNGSKSINCGGGTSCWSDWFLYPDMLLSNTTYTLNFYANAETSWKVRTGGTGTELSIILGGNNTNDNIWSDNSPTESAYNAGFDWVQIAPFLTTNLTVKTNNDTNSEYHVTNATGNVTFALNLTGLGDINNYTVMSNQTTNGSSLITLELQPPYKPPVPTDATTATGNFYVNTSWQPGVGNVTDSYNVSVSGTWYNNSVNYINSSLVPHGFQNVTVYAFNASNGGVLSDNSIVLDTQVPNNLPAIYNVTSSSAVAEGQVVYVHILNTTDLDGDNVTYGTNRTDLFTDFNNVTGEGNWTVPHLSQGVIFITDFYLSDGYGVNHSVMSTIVATGMNTTQSFAPISPIVMSNNSNTELTVNCNLCHITHTANMSWLLNGVEVQSNINTSTASRIFSPVLSGTYNMTVRAGISAGNITHQWDINVLDLRTTNLTHAKVTKKTIAWEWSNPTNGYFACTELYLDGVYQSCDASTSTYMIDLSVSSEHIISLRVKDTLNNYHNFTNDTVMTLASTSAPLINTSYLAQWFAPTLAQSFLVNTGYNSTVPLRNITLEVRTKNENTHVKTLTSYYIYNWTLNTTIKTLTWDGKADNAQLVPDAQYISQVTVIDFDGNTATITNTSSIGVDNTAPTSIMDFTKSRLWQSYYYKSDYDNADVLRVNLGYYFGEFNTTTTLTQNPITHDTTLANLVIRKVGYISTNDGVTTFTIMKDSDGKAWMWVDNVLVYNSNAGLTSTQLLLNNGLHEVSILYAKGTVNTGITLNPKANGSTMVFVSPVVNNNLSLFANDYNGSGVSQIRYSLDEGATYNTYLTPVNVTGVATITVCSRDEVTNTEVCKRYSATYTTKASNPGVAYNATVGNGTVVIGVFTINASAPTFPTSFSVMPNNTQITNALNNASPQNGTGGCETCEAQIGDGGWPASQGYGTYIYDYFNSSIYYADGVGSASSKLSVVQHNTSYAWPGAHVRVSSSDGNVFNSFNVLAYPFLSEQKTNTIIPLAGNPFGLIRADVTKGIVDNYAWLTYAASVYAPASNITFWHHDANLSDTIQFTTTVQPWTDVDSPTKEISNVQMILYAPANPYNGAPAKILQVDDIGTVTQDGGVWTATYNTNLYVDLVGTYHVILWMPTIGGVIADDVMSLGYGNIDQAQYNSIKLNQFAVNETGYIIIVPGVNLTNNETGYVVISPGSGVSNGETGYITIVSGGNTTGNETGYITITIT